MPKVFGYQLNRQYAAPPDVVFDVLADVPGWTRWAKPVILASKWENAAGEVGSVRAAGIWPILIRERITAVEPGKLISYTYVGRIVPVRDYRATIVLSEREGGGTELSWAAEFGSVIPLTGRLVTLVVKAPVLFMAWRLGRESSRRG